MSNEENLGIKSDLEFSFHFITFPFALLYTFLHKNLIVNKET